MKKLLLIIALVAAIFCTDTASACVSGRCGSYNYYPRTSYARSYYGRGFGRSYYGRGYSRYGRGYSRYGYRSYGHRYARRSYGRYGFGRTYSHCTRCGYSRW